MVLIFFTTPVQCYDGHVGLPLPGELVRVARVEELHVLREQLQSYAVVKGDGEYLVIVARWLGINKRDAGGPLIRPRFVSRGSLNLGTDEPGSHIYCLIQSLGALMLIHSRCFAATCIPEIVASRGKADTRVLAALGVNKARSHAQCKRELRFHLFARDFRSEP